MTDIIIYTNAEALLHKQGKLPNDDDWSETGDYYWHLPRTPKKLKQGDRIYFALKGYIRGYFIVDFIEVDDECDINFNSQTWKDIEPIGCKPFQGFKYADKVPGLGGGN